MPLGADEAISIKVSPSVSFAPANVSIRATVPSNAKNRAVLVEADSANFYRSSEIPLNGDQAPRTNMFVFRDLPQGMYEVKATLLGPGGESRGKARLQLNVIENGPGR
jgi:hypothetical protein